VVVMRNLRGRARDRVKAGSLLERHGRAGRGTWPALSTRWRLAANRGQSATAALVGPGREGRATWGAARVPRAAWHRRPAQRRGVRPARLPADDEIGVGRGLRLRARAGRTAETPSTC